MMASETKAWQEPESHVEETPAEDVTRAATPAEDVTRAATPMGNAPSDLEELQAEATPIQTPKKDPVTPLDIFSWVRHVTIAPPCTLPAGSEFTKTWRVKHFASGSEYSFDKVRLVHKSFGMLGDACKASLEFRREDIHEDDEVEVTIAGLKVPCLRGMEVVEHWRFEDDNGVEYGQPLRLRFHVEKADSGSSSLTSSAVIMPSSDAVTPKAIVEIEDIVPGIVIPSGSALDIPRTASTEPSVDDDTDSVISFSSSVSTTSFVDVEDAASVASTATPSLRASDEEEMMRQEFEFIEDDSSEDEIEPDELF